MKERLNRAIKLPAVLGVMVALVLFAGVGYVYAESFPGGDDNGKTSRLKELSDGLTGLGYGSDANSPDWGARWNRIATAAEWTPTGNAAPNDVLQGKTFYSNTRGQQTGTGVTSTLDPCPTQAYHDSYGAPVNQTTNCTDSVTWTVPDPVVTGDDKHDPRTGIIWSRCLVNADGLVIFATSGCTTWSWDATHANNIAAGNKTAIQLCSERNGGGVWRLPTQKELMQAYIDGSFFNLASPSALHWSATENSASGAWYVGLNVGATNGATKSSAYQVRCVR